MCSHFLFMPAEGRSPCIDISDQIDVIINALSPHTPSQIPASKLSVKKLSISEGFVATQYIRFVL